MATGFDQETKSIDPADYSVLVCDDDESIRELLNTALKDWGFRPIIVGNGEET